MLGAVAHEVIATCILAYLAYILYCSVNVREITKTVSKELFKKCLAYIFMSLGLMGFLIICYDFSTGNSKHLPLPDNHCAYTDFEIYNTLIIPICFAFLNKIFQIMLFIIYLYYFYKFIVISSNTVIPNINNDLIKKFAKIAFVFGAAIGLSLIAVILGEFTGYRDYGRLISRAFIILQLCGVNYVQRELSSCARRNSHQKSILQPSITLNQAKLMSKLYISNYYNLCKFINGCVCIN